MAVAGWFVEDSSVVTSGTVITVDIEGDGGMGAAATRAIIINDHATGVLSVQFSANGVDFTTKSIEIEPKASLTLDNCLLSAVKVDADVSGTTFLILAWRAGETL